MNLHIQKALQHINNANYAGYFDEMNKISIPEEFKTNYVRQKNVFISGQAPFDFHTQLRALAREIDDFTSKSQNTTHNTSTTNGDGNITIIDSNNSSINVNNSSKTSESKAKQKILFLAANPVDMDYLYLDSEYRSINNELRRNEYYELLKPVLAARVEDLIREMNQRPYIVHFAGHGEEEGIMLANSSNKSILMGEKPLKRLFKQHRESIKLVVLNSCYSENQAKFISEFGIYVIGVKHTLDDGVAIRFSAGLYIGLSEGKTVEEAYDDAMIIIETEYPKLPADECPAIWKDAEKLDI